MRVALHRDGIEMAEDLQEGGQMSSVEEKVVARHGHLHRFRRALTLHNGGDRMMIRLSRRPLFMIAVIAVFLPVVADAKSRRTAQVYTCHFPKGGTVIIDTREPKASITVNGTRHPAQSGSYFYQSVDGNVFVAFGPGASFKFWELNGERDYRCRRS
jgi:hypothetical protein